MNNELTTNDVVIKECHKAIDLAIENTNNNMWAIASACNTISDILSGSDLVNDLNVRYGFKRSTIYASIKTFKKAVEIGLDPYTTEWRFGNFQEIASVDADVITKAIDDNIISIDSTQKELREWKKSLLAIEESEEETETETETETKEELPIDDIIAICKDVASRYGKNTEMYRKAFNVMNYLSK